MFDLEKRYCYSLALLLVLFVLAACTSGSPAPPGEEEQKEEPALAALAAPLSPLWRLGDRGSPEFSVDGGLSWEDRGGNLPRRILWPFLKEESLRYTSLDFDPLNPLRCVVSTSQDIFYTTDGGDSWQSIPLSKIVKKNIYITSTALNPQDPQTFLAGTSFRGVYEIFPEDWQHYSRGAIPFLGDGFYEEISDVAYDNNPSGRFWVLLSHGKGLVEAHPSRKEWTPVSLPPGEPWQEIRMETTREGGRLILQNPGEQWAADPETWDWRFQGAPSPAPLPLREEDEARRRLAAGRRAFYLPSRQVSDSLLAGHMDFARANGLNALVVDAKNDKGELTYPSLLSRPREIGAVQPSINWEKLLGEAKERDLYVIARVVLFKDARLYQAQGGRLAFKDKRTGEPWGHWIDEELADKSLRLVQKEFWVDIFSPEVWRYNTDIAEELQEMGVDEIQFDYIRFPSDGPVHTLMSENQREGMSRVDALESFLRMVREVVDIPVSAALYGFNSWYSMGSWIGQDIHMLADYADVISPMFYPSHFSSNFLSPSHKDYIKRAGGLYRQGTMRARNHVQGRSLIRPYIQAFLLSREFWMGEPQYQEYLFQQLRGARTSQASGYALWNNSGNYYMVREPLEGSY